MKLSQVIAVYIDNRSKTTWKSHNTRKTVISILRSLSEAIKERLHFDPETSEVDDVLVWAAINSRWQEGNSTWPNTLNKIRSFFKWATTRGYEFGDMASILEYKVKQPDIEKHYVTERELEHLLSVLWEHKRYRDWACIGFAFASHRRSIEVCNLQWKDVDFTPRSDAPYGVYWFTETKTHQGRKMLDLLEEEASYLKEWKKLYEREVGSEVEPSWYIFPTRENGTGRIRRIRPEIPVADRSHLFREAFRLAGIWTKGKAGHALRRGGMEEVFQDLTEAGVDDPIGVLIVRTKQTRSTAESYLDKRLAEKRSRDGYAAVAALRKARKEGKQDQVSSKSPSQSDLVDNSNNVIDFSSRFQARRTS